MGNMFKRSGAIVAALVLGTTLVDGQPVEESLVALSARLDVRAQNYSLAEPDRTVVFSDLTYQPVTLEVEIANNTGRTLELGTTDRSWVSSLVVQTFRLRNSQREDVSHEVRTQIQAPRGNAITTRARRSARFRGVIGRDDGTPLAPGRYDLSITLRESALSPFARTLNNILARTIHFEVREPTSEAELADAYLQRSYQERLAGRPAESRQWAQRVLALNSTSIPALTDVASAWLDGEANCSQAVPLYRQAIVLLNTGGDPLLKMSDVGREELADALRAKLATQCGAQ